VSEAADVVREFFEQTLAFGSPATWTEAQHAVSDRLTTPDFEYREDPKWPGADVHRGRQAVKDAFAQVAEIFPTMKGKLESVQEGPEGVVALVRFVGEGAASGAPSDHVWGYRCLVEDGRLSLTQAYWDGNEALRDAGVRD
jgi:ketosteroid isomerase-like protein